MRTNPFFAGDEPETRSVLSRLDDPYVHVLVRPDGRRFHIGKGRGYRALEHVLEARHAHLGHESNPFKCNAIRRVEAAGGRVGYVIDSVHPTDDAALAREGELIASIGRLHEGGPLTNLAAGGGRGGAAPFSAARHAATLSGRADHPEQAVINEAVQDLLAVGSVPIKAASRLTRPRPSKPHAKPRRPSPRVAAAMAIAVAAQGGRPVAGQSFARAFDLNGVRAILENGVMADALRAGMVSIDGEAEEPASERLSLTPSGVGALHGLLPSDRLAAIFGD